MSVELLKDFAEQTWKEMLQEKLRDNPQEILSQVPRQTLVESLTPEERVSGLTQEQLLKLLSPEMRAALAPPPPKDQPPT